MANRNVNQTTLIGNVTGKPELNHTAGGTAVTNFSVATNSTRKDADGEYVEHAQYHRCTAWGRLAEIVCEYVNKGQLVYVQGELNYGSYPRTLESGDVVDWPTVEITVRDFLMLGGRPRHESNGQAEEPVAEGGEMEPDDDLPF